MVNLSAEDTMTELLSDEASVSDVEISGMDFATVDNGLHVSVIWSLSGEVLATVLVSGRSSVWDLKCLIEKCIIPLRIVATRITVMLGLQVLADADTLDDAGIVEGTTLSITAGSPYKILLCREGTAEMWNDGGRFERTFLGHTSEIRTVEFSPDDTFVITSSSDCTAKLWQADVVECILTFRGHTTPVTSAVFNITGTEVLTAWMAMERQFRHMCPHFASRPQACSCEHCFVSRRTYGPHNLSVQHHCMESADGHACVGCPRLTGVLPQACKLLTKRWLALYMRISPKCHTPLDNSRYASKISLLGRAYWGGSLRFVLTGQFAHGHREL